MCYKIFLVCVLATGHAAMAQEPDSVVYSHICVHTRIDEIKNKKKKVEWEEIAGGGKAQLIYSPTYLLLKTSKGADTVFLSSVNETMRSVFGKIISISYNNHSEVMSLCFVDKTSVKKCKQFMQENGGHFRKETVSKITGIILCTSLLLGLLALSFPFWLLF